MNKSKRGNNELLIREAEKVIPEYFLALLTLRALCSKE